MGMPISNYTVLKALGDKKASPHEYEKRTALDALSPFNLFAFIIHDPEEHPDFSRQLRRSFDRLDFVTGEKLLFFALVEPPSEWLAHAHRRHYYGRFSSYATKELLASQSEGLAADESKDFWNILKFQINKLLSNFIKCNFLSGNEEFLPDQLEVARGEDGGAAKEYKKAKDEALATLETIVGIVERGLETYFVFENIKPFLEERRRLTESENKRLEKLQNFIPAEKAFAIIAVCAELVNNHVHEPESRRAIAKGLLRAANIED